MKNKLNVLVTILVILSALLCLTLCVQIISGREANLFGYRVCTILTGSMEPTLPTGSTIVVHTVDPADLQVGDVITFSSRDPSIAGMTNTHRIIALETDSTGTPCFVTQGDANPVEDSYRVYYEDVQGKMVLHLDFSGLATFMKFVRTPAGFVSVIVMPVLFICWCFLKDFRRQVKAMAQLAAEEALAAETPAQETPTEETQTEETPAETAAEETETP